MRAAAARARPALLQPVMRIEGVAPSEYPGEVLGRLDKRRGAILDVSDRGPTKVIQAEAALQRMFGYATELRSLTQGRAVFTKSFTRYDAAG